VEFT